MYKDYIFHVNWEDRLKTIHEIGVLAKIDKYFYFIVKDEKNASKAYTNGFNGVPGFKPNRVYKSEELFDFFKFRVFKTANVNYCEELRKTKGKSMTDSFLVDEIPEEEIQKNKIKILEAYELQEKIKNIIDEKYVEQ